MSLTMHTIFFVFSVAVLGFVLMLCFLPRDVQQVFSQMRKPFRKGKKRGRPRKKKVKPKRKKRVSLKARFREWREVLKAKRKVGDFDVGRRILIIDAWVTTYASEFGNTLLLWFLCVLGVAFFSGAVYFVFVEWCYLRAAACTLFGMVMFVVMDRMGTPQVQTGSGQQKPTKEGERE